VTSCLEVRRLMPRLIALELPEDVERGVREHLRGCERCREFAAVREPALALALRVGTQPAAEDEHFVGQVLAGMHQRALERRLGGRRLRAFAAAAVVVVVFLLGAVVVGHLESPSLQAVAEAPPHPARVVEPAFVEVDETGVRVYQLSPASQSREAIQVAFIVDPHLEL
jgi:predicted anti-sigma-YlaC factor YlaD